MSFAAPAHAPVAYAPAPTALAAYGPGVLAASRAGAGRPAAAAARPGAGYAGTAARYRDAELAAATPGQLVVMLFDKCVLTVRRAEAAFAAGDVAGRVEHVCKAAEMVGELRASLDFEAGGALSTQLDGLYAWVVGELYAANREAGAARLAPVLRVLAELRDGFAGAQAQLAADGPAAGRPA